MIVDDILNRAQCGLLVSVRSADEASAALAGGADVIDVKEPSRGSLGAASSTTIADVVRAVAGRAPVTAAAGELIELLPQLEAGTCAPMPAGVSLVKIGLAQCGRLDNWPAAWQRAIAALRQPDRADHALPVAVVYADWRGASAPQPEEIHSRALAIGCRVVLIDTWDKTRGALFDHCTAAELRVFIERIRRDRQMAVVLAGSLSRTNLLAAAELRPHLVAVRGAACEADRTTAISQRRVAELKQILQAAAPEPQHAKRTPLGSLAARQQALRHKDFS